ncbi:MAG: IS110 family transposase [Deltaproteobacteria bacterium]|nr:IS110 family transposase [Deltaproteobacteria bacterium]
MLDRRSVAALCGVAPYNRDSGRSSQNNRRKSCSKKCVVFSHDELCSQ